MNQLSMEMELLQDFGSNVKVKQLIPDTLEFAWTIVGRLYGEVTNSTLPQAVPVEEGLMETFDPMGGDYTPLVTALISPQPQPATTASMHSHRDSVVLKRLEVPLSPIGVHNDTVIFGARGDKFSLPPPATKAKKKRKCRMRQDDNAPYVKKPPNAFMLFRAEQRPNVVAKLNMRNSAAVNAEVGKMWKSLSATEQQDYYGKAERLRLIHLQLHPDWSAKDNYGKKRKRVRSNAAALH